MEAARSNEGSPQKALAAGRSKSAAPVDVIRADKSHALVEGIFVLKDAKPYQADAAETTKGAIQKVEIVTKRQTRGRYELHFQTEPMSPRELRVLHAVIAIAMGAHPSRRLILSSSRIDNDRVAKEAWQRIGIGQIVAPKMNAVDIRTSLREIARFCGLNSVSAHRLRWLLQGLIELSKVNITVFEKDDEAGSAGRESSSRPRIRNSRGGMRLLGYVNVGQQVVVTLNPFLAAAILDDGNQYALINMQDFYRAKGEATLLLLRRLSAFIDFGHSNRVAMAKLELYVYGTALDPVDPALSRQRKGRVETIRKAIKSLIAIGWGCSEVSPGIWEFTRPHPQPERQLSLEGIVAPGVERGGEES